jgi:4-hydroxy-4-methyl-2-oxoglutarate aldolase
LNRAGVTTGTTTPFPGQLAVPFDALERLRGYDTPTLANAIELFDLRPRDEGFASCEIGCLFPNLEPMVGFAATATFRTRGPSSNTGQPALWEHVRTVAAPRVVVTQDVDDFPGHGSLWGEVNATIFSALGCIGAITNGCVRDVDEARKLGFHFFARGLCVSHGYLRVERVGVEVTIGGLTIRPGDLLHADQHGILVIPPEIAVDLPEAADEVRERERRLLDWVRSPEFDPDRLAEMKSKLY